MNTHKLLKRLRLYELHDQWVARLGLQHWCIVLEAVDEPEGSANSIASVHTSDDYDTATIQYKIEFLERDDPEKLEETVVHELLHVLFRDLDRAEHSVCSALSRDAYSAYSDRLEHEQEGVIDRLARVLVKCGTLRNDAEAATTSPS